MKVDVITLQAVQNYGSVLQALATQKLFEKHDCDVTIINYQRENVRNENILQTWSKGNPIKAFIMYPTTIRWKHVFGDFQRKYLHLTDKIYTSEKDFEDYPLEADAYCTGSDQVWNSKWNRGVIPLLYLSFVPQDKYKFSLATSFGQSVLSDEEVASTQKYIDQYNKISVREASGIDILKNQYQYKDVIHLIDPTVAVPPEFWKKIEAPRQISKEYILIYNLNRSKEFDEYAIRLSQKCGLKLVRLSTRYDQFYRPGKSVFVPEVSEFIGLIDNARYVLTDSFHATAFSMNLNTEPICVYPKEFGGRLESFLRLTESTQRQIVNYNDFEVVNRPVDFENVNRILELERKKVNAFIDSVIKDVDRKAKKESMM